MNKESLEGKRIAIYGGASQIASQTALDALNQGAEVTAFVRDPKKAERLAHEGVEIFVGDITSRKDVMRMAENQGFDVTINFAAHFNQSKRSEQSRKVNVDGEQYVLDATEQFYIPRHIFISTIGTQMEGPNSYRDTKLEAEDLVRNSGVPEWMILRYANVIGTDIWNNPFVSFEAFGKKLGISKIPTRKAAPFSYLGIETATEATLKAITSKPNQTITVVDGFTTLDGYLAAMARVNNLNFMLALPGSVVHPALVAANKTADLFGKNFPLTPGTSLMMTNPPELEFQNMSDLGVNGKSFEDVVSHVKP